MRTSTKRMAWSLTVEGNFMSVYRASVDIFNVESKNLKLYSKFLGALDLRNQDVIKRVDPLSSHLMPKTKVREESPKIHCSLLNLLPRRRRVIEVRVARLKAFHPLVILLLLRLRPNSCLPDICV